MKITPLKILGAYLIEADPFRDERGFFYRQFCLKEFGNIGFEIKQCNVSRNVKKGILRGMHYQEKPYPEVKMVSCFEGAIYDVIVDLRKDSPTYTQWIGMELSEDNFKSVYIPEGIAHGFQTLTDKSMLYYQLGEFFLSSILCRC